MGRVTKYLGRLSTENFAETEDILMKCIDAAKIASIFTINSKM